ncbi:hypothetical protein DH2020_035446 [Rehmannia glutinosa]|uniref:Uncharacterized protein n=1 Tax=Rehmannia glutinosa TaxID=99300 RepID=A0ABR0V6M1_REHGL
MDTDSVSVQSGFTYMGRKFSDLSLNDNSSSAFSDCNSDRSGEFPTASSQSRRLFLSCASDNSDEVISQLVSDLDSNNIDEQKQAAMEIRLLAKNKPENRIKIARAGAIKPLVSIVSSNDPQLQEYGVTAILNLSLCDENKEVIASSGAIKPLVRALRNPDGEGERGVRAAKTLAGGGEQNRDRPIRRDPAARRFAGGRQFSREEGRVDGAVLAVLGEGEQDEGGAGGDNEAAGGDDVGFGVEHGGQIGLCEDCLAYRTMVAREGAIPPLVALSQTGTSRAKQKAEALIELLRQPRSTNAAAKNI